MQEQNRTARTPSSNVMAMLLAGAAIAPLSTARADVVVSTSKTQNMSCSGGVCAPTSADAVLNVTDLENYLAAGSLAIITTGSGVQANNIRLDASLAWSSGSVLTFDAYQSILIYDPVSVSGAGGLSIVSNDGGSGGYFGFGPKGDVTFANLSSPLTVNGTSYILVGDVATLSADIAANSAGNYALANSYDAASDGTYQDSPILTQFSGAFEGLGNTISRLSIYGTGNPYVGVGLFSELALNNQSGGMVENITLTEVRIGGNGFAVGGLVGINIGTVVGSYVRGSVESELSGGIDMALLVGVNFGSVTRCSASGAVTTLKQAGVGGLVSAGGTISQSFADARVSAGANSAVGGLVGGNQGATSDSYAIGKISAGTTSDIGGLVGQNERQSTIGQSYSAAAVRMSTGTPRGHKGGLIGADYAAKGSNSSTYWDLQTSHVNQQSRGAGTPKHDPGIQGLTTRQLQSGLPSGFDPTIWTQNPKINNGFPYLIANPPRE